MQLHQAPFASADSACSAPSSAAFRHAQLCSPELHESIAEGGGVKEHARLYFPENSDYRHLQAADLGCSCSTVPFKNKIIARSFFVVAQS